MDTVDKWLDGFYVNLRFFPGLTEMFRFPIGQMFLNSFTEVSPPLPFFKKKCLNPCKMPDLKSPNTLAAAVLAFLG